MDKPQRRVIMSKFLNKGKNKSSSNAPKTTTSKKPTTPADDKNGFYETLIIKRKPEPQKQIKKDTQICKKMGSIVDLTKKKYMIPSQFPNITQPHKQ